MFARRTAAEILSGDQDRGFTKASIVQWKGHVRLSVRQKAPIVEKEFAKACALNPLQELLRNNLIRIDVWPIKRKYQACVISKWLHDFVSSFRFQVSIQATQNS